MIEHMKMSRFIDLYLCRLRVFLWTCGWISLVGPILQHGKASAEATPAGAAPSDRRVISFDRDIRPILSEKCFTCHGPDLANRKSELRLDTAENAYAPAASGMIAVVPNKPMDSELYRRVISDDSDEKMPPVKTGKKLSSAEIEKLKVWIEEGAKYQRHWAFISPKRPEVPNVGDGISYSNPIDRFILARLERDGLEALARGGSHNA